MNYGFHIYISLACFELLFGIALSHRVFLGRNASSSGVIAVHTFHTAHWLPKWLYTSLSTLYLDDDPNNSAVTAPRVPLFLLTCLFLIENALLLLVGSLMVAPRLQELSGNLAVSNLILFLLCQQPFKGLRQLTLRRVALVVAMRRVFGWLAYYQALVHILASYATTPNRREQSLPIQFCLALMLS